MTELRPYQRAAIDAIKDYWANGGGNPLVDMATGVGKSVVIATLIKELLELYPTMRILVLVHVKELVEQDAMAVLRMWPGAPIGINSAGLGQRDRFAQVLFASIQSVHRMGAQLGPRDLILVDEAHLIPNAGQGMYLRLLDDLRELVPDLRVGGFTATPYRMDSGRLDEGDNRIFDEIVYSYGVAQGVRDGFLSPLVSKATGSEIDVSNVTRRGGEFIAGELERAADRRDLIEAAVSEIIERGTDRKSWLVFCSGVQHATNVRDEMRARGVIVETITGKTPHGERDSIIREFKAGRIRCLTNANVLTTGFDAPAVDLVAMLRPTLSTGLYIQSLGRGTRLSPGTNKTDCLVLDFAGNIRRHGPVDQIQVGSSAKSASAGRDDTTVKVDSVRAKICPTCQTYISIMEYSCSSCGHEWDRPLPKHEAIADTAPVMMLTAPPPAWMPVSSVSFSRHTKRYDPEAPPTMRVDYLCGMVTHSEWVCFEHVDFARRKAEKWWRDMRGGEIIPATVDQAISLAEDGEIVLPAAIMVRQEGKFERIVARRFTPIERSEVA